MNSLGVSMICMVVVTIFAVQTNANDLDMGLDIEEYSMPYGCEPNGHKCKKSCHNPIPCYKAQDTGYWHCYASAVEGQRVYDEKEAADTKGQMDEVQDEANDDTSNDVNDVADDSVRGRGKWVCGPGELCCPGGRGRGI